jgi:hypothetical protein
MFGRIEVLTGWRSDEMNTALGTIKRHPLKKKWAYETDFSNWLATDGLTQISELIGLELCDVRREVLVGGYKADIVAQCEGEEGLVIIENQYKTVNHDHLGKLITYASGLEAKTAVLIVEDVRPEAVTAIRWLNEVSRDEFAFYLIKAELLQIEDSPYAPVFSVVVEPDKFVRETRAHANELTDLKKQQLEFWEDFNNYASKHAAFKKVFPNLRKPLPQAWMDLPCGSSEYHLVLLAINRDEYVGVEFNIHNDKDLFAKINEQKCNIETECGVTFDWKLLPDKKASRIVATLPCNWLEDERDTCFEWLCDLAIKMRKVFPKYAN